MLSGLLGQVDFPSGQEKACLSHTSAKTESENNRPAAQGTVTELHPAAH